MKIGFNAQLLALEESYRAAGISRYIKSLLDAFHKKKGAADLTVFTAERQAVKLYKNFAVLCSRTAAPWRRIVWEQLWSPLLLNKHKIQIYHSPMQVLPLWGIKKIKKVITIHDLANFKYPQFYLGKKQKYLTSMTALSVKRADRIIAVSQNTRQDLIDILKVPAQKIAVIYNGVTFHKVSGPELKKIQQKFQLPAEFLLFVGTLEPRKNVVTLINALESLSKTRRIRIPLVIAGPLGWKYRELLTKINNSPLQIIQTGFISEQELNGLYQSAKLFVYPSLYEGFGFPVLEAMAAGTPVICSNTSSLPEVGGSAALYFDPQKSQDLARKIAQVWTTTTLRTKLSISGKKQAAKFTWQRCAEETLKLYLD